MPHIDFANALWKKQEWYTKERGNYIDRFNAFQNIFNYFQTGQTVAQIACGSILDDLFLTVERVGKRGRIILIDEDPAFVYNRASKILGEENLPRKKEFYIQTEEGKQLLKDLFSQVNIEVYVQHLPPYPQQINDESIDHVMAINAAFELMATPIGGTPANIEGLISETYKKLRNGGSLIVQGLMGSDIDLFRMHIYNTIKRNGLSLEEDLEVLESLDGPLSP
ncbi:MAG: hypothetical protein NTY20_04575, partial [Candidatus Aenigmarchaeota archaeon]|nr:hypothetical protein [Candidatus Aenigmarchaeota archaeon]